MGPIPQITPSYAKGVSEELTDSLRCSQIEKTEVVVGAKEVGGAGTPYLVEGAKVKNPLRGLNEKGEALITILVGELKPHLNAINEIIEKYNLVDPQKNVCPTWYKGQITIAFSDPMWG